MSVSDEVVPTPDIIPELDDGDPRRYRMNMDWVWSTTHNPELLKRATVRATVTAPDRGELRSLFDEWARHLRGPSGDEIFVHGGWFCQREQPGSASLVLLFGSGGQDVAESLDYGIQWFSGAVLGAIPSAAVTWQELPLD